MDLAKVVLSAASAVVSIGIVDDAGGFLSSGSNPMTRNFVRDQTIRFSVAFLNVSGSALNPASASVTLKYLLNGCWTRQTYPLVLTDGFWIYDWDSSVADPGRVYGHVVTGGATPTAAYDFEINLTANKANLAA